MKKRMLSIVLMLVMLVSVVPMPQAGAAASYSVDKAIAYAKQHWNDGQGECAEFVSRCVRAGGLDMKVIATTRSCLNAAAKASGLPIKELKLNSEGHATKADNGSILAAGDIVAQYCKTDDLYPHIMLCGGYDSQGRATFYAHNGAINNKVQVLNVNTAYDHTLACDIRAHVVHLSSLDDGIFTSSDSTSSSPGVTFSLPTDPNYTSKQKITNTNAVLVNKITKPAGTKVTQMGLHVYDFNGSNIGDHWDYVSNVSDSTTTFHCWYDLNSEFHATLTPGNTYKYYFYGEFDGKKVTGPTFSFTTTGTRPYVNFWLSDTEKVSFPLETGLTYYAHGEFPDPYEKEGYTFAGWYTCLLYTSGAFRAVRRTGQGGEARRRHIVAQEIGRINRRRIIDTGLLRRRDRMVIGEIAVRFRVPKRAQQEGGVHLRGTGLLRLEGGRRRAGGQAARIQILHIGLLPAFQIGKRGGVFERQRLLLRTEQAHQHGGRRRAGGRAVQLIPLFGAPEQAEIA